MRAWILVLTTTVIIGAAGSANAARPGDLDRDGDVDSHDAVILQNHIDGKFELGCAEAIAADVAGHDAQGNTIPQPDGVVDGADLERIEACNGCVIWELSPLRNAYKESETTEGTPDVRVGSFNIQAGDNGAASSSPWDPVRKDLLIESFNRNRLDVVGLQEVYTANGAHYDDVKQLLQNDLAIHYTYTPSYPGEVGLGGSDLPIYYRADRFEPISGSEHGTLITRFACGLPEQRNVSGLPPLHPIFGMRIGWIRLREKATGASFRVYNVHLCNSAFLDPGIEPLLGSSGTRSDAAARHRTHTLRTLARVISQHQEEFGDPFFVIGDFNERPSSSRGNIKWWQGLLATLPDPYVYDAVHGFAFHPDFHEADYVEPGLQTVSPAVQETYGSFAPFSSQRRTINRWSLWNWDKNKGGSCPLDLTVLGQLFPHPYTGEPIDYIFTQIGPDSGPEVCNARIDRTRRDIPSGILGEEPLGLEDLFGGCTASQRPSDHYLVTATLQLRSGDLDEDGFPDRVDNCLGLANPDQSDADQDGYGNVCDADCDGDGVVGFGDFMALVGQIGNDCGWNPSLDCSCDFTSDDRVGGPDFSVLLSQFGSEIGPSGFHP